MEQHTAKRLRYSFLFLLSAIVLLIFVISAQSQVIFGQAEDMMGETPKEIITACENNELATLGANGLRCKTVEVIKTPTAQDINITDTTCPFGIKNFNIDSSRNLSYECVVPVECSENQFLSVQADLTFTCIGYNNSTLKDSSCVLGETISGFDEEGVPICTPIPSILAGGINCPEGQYLSGVRLEASLYVVATNLNNIYELNTEATVDRSPFRYFGDLLSSEDEPRSITEHNGKLYMIGDDTDSLYELDTKVTRNTRNISTIVGITFGDQEDDPQSITSHNGKLYMIGQSSNSLYVLNTEATGDPATRIGEPFDTEGAPLDIEGAPRSITSHNGKLYMIGGDTDSLYVLDIEATGNPATIIGESFSDQEDEPRSITSHNGKLYMVGSGSDSLYELNTEATGDPATKIGERFKGEGNPRSITSHNGSLYMVGRSSRSLYVLNTEPKQYEDTATRIGRKTTFLSRFSGLQSITSYSGDAEAICADIQ